jgi:hemerythrin-like domain-containing protein
VCNYCGCRALEAIAELTDEHVRILSLSADLRRAVGRGEHAAAADLLGTLNDVLELHDAVEELSLYPAMARDPELAEKIGTLFDEHDELDRVVRAAMAAANGAGPNTADWVGVLAALEMLAEHIDHEEHGVFPAAAVSLDPADWEHAGAVRRQQTQRRASPTEPHGESWPGPG